MAWLGPPAPRGSRLGCSSSRGAEILLSSLAGGSLGSNLGHHFVIAHMAHLINAGVPCVPVCRACEKPLSSVASCGKCHRHFHASCLVGELCVACLPSALKRKWEQSSECVHVRNAEGSSKGGRVDAPAFNPSRRGSVRKAQAAQRNDPKGLMEAYEKEKFANSSGKPYASRLKWWSSFASEGAFETYPLTKHTLKMGLARLKAGRYRSARLYAQAWKREHLNRGFPWSFELDFEMKDGIRSCLRGIGPQKQAPPLPLDCLARAASTPAASGSPGATREALAVMCWWGLRELEAGAARFSQMSMLPGPGCGRASFSLPVSKADPTGKGAIRIHGCCCKSGALLCPVRAARQLVAYALQRLPKDAGRDSGPLFCTGGGGWPTKHGTVAMLRGHAVALGASSDEAALVSGHSCRVTGAQMFAAAGVELHVIQLWFRWGSKAVERYIRDAPLSSSFALAGRISLAMAGDRYAQAARRRLPRSVVRRRAGGRELLKKMSELDEKLDLALAEKLSFAPQIRPQQIFRFLPFRERSALNSVWLELGEGSVRSGDLQAF